MIPFDPSKPNAARVYDFLLGGKNNYQADRTLAAELLSIAPEAALIARDNRQFLQRAVEHVSMAGVTQFIDIGSGLPTAGNVHEVAQNAAPGARVVYVDHDPVVLSHARALLAEADPDVTVVPGDLRKPAEIIENAELTAHLDLSRPVAVVLAAILHFLDDDEAYEVVDLLKDRVAAGSYLVISHATADGVAPQEAEQVRQLYANTTPLTLRSHEQVARFFDGFTLVKPGVADIAEWHGIEQPRSRRTVGYGGVAVKP